MSIATYLHNIAHAVLPVWVNPPAREKKSGLPAALDMLARSINEVDDERIRKKVEALCVKSKVTQLEHLLYDLKQFYSYEVDFTLTSDSKE